MITDAIILKSLLVTYDQTKVQYVVEVTGKMKRYDGRWEACVVYRKIETGEIFVRDEETFRKKFSTGNWHYVEGKVAT